MDKAVRRVEEMMALYGHDAPVSAVSGDAIVLRRKEHAAMRAFLLDRGAILSKSVRGPDNRVQVKEIVRFGGLSDWFYVSGGISAGCGPAVGMTETKPIRCQEAGCADARPEHVGFRATAVAVREVEGRTYRYSRSAHACPHTCESFSRDFLLTMSETRALSLTFRLATGLENATQEEIGPETPAARASVMGETWAIVPKTAACWRFFDGGGNAKAAPFGFRWKKDETGRFELYRRTDEGAPPHPSLTGGCEFHGIPR